MGEIDDTDMVEGSFVRANEHNLETVRLPAALKRERKQLYVGELNASRIMVIIIFGLRSSFHAVFESEIG